MTDIDITKILQAQISDISSSEARQRQAEAAALESVRQVAAELATAAARALYPDPMHPDARKVQVSACVKENSFPTLSGLPGTTWRLATGVDVTFGSDISFVAAIDAEPVSTANISLLTLRQRERSQWMATTATSQWYNDATSAMRAVFTRPAEAERIARVLRNLAKSSKSGA